MSGFIELHLSHYVKNGENKLVSININRIAAVCPSSAHDKGSTVIMGDEFVYEVEEDYSVVMFSIRGESPNAKMPLKPLTPLPNKETWKPKG